MKPKFSFVIPSLNEEKYIGHCLSSIRKQKRRDYEIILVDSYSKDKTVKIAKRYGARVLYERRKGPAIARNTGAKRARGDILIFADADVIFDKGFLNGVEEHFSAKTTAGGICNMRAYDGNRAIDLNYRFGNFITHSLNAAGVPITMGSCFMFRRDLFRKSGGFNPEFMSNEDHDLAKRIAKMGRFCYFGDVRIATSTRRVRKWGLLKAIKIYIKSTAVFWINHSYLKDYWTK